jgi:hypothetical protein
MDFLKESHPERLRDNRFIIARTETATEAYARAIRRGDTPIEAAHRANAALFRGLHFSKHDAIVNILWNEFPDDIPEDEAKSLAIDFLPDCEHIFAEYPLTDGFAYEPEYDLLYTELTGTIALMIENRNS